VISSVIVKERRRVRRSSGQPQGTDHLDLAISGLGLAGHRASLHRPRRCLGIERIGLAASSSDLAVMAVGTLDLDDDHPADSEPASQAGAVAPGPLDPDPLDHPKAARPRQERREPGRRRRDTPGSQAPTELIERHADVLIDMRIDANRDADFAIPRIASDCPHADRLLNWTSSFPDVHRPRRRTALRWDRGHASIRSRSSRTGTQEVSPTPTDKSA
jgi:hypothetical protein